MIDCSCDISFSNTGRANCVPVFSIARKIVVVPMYDSTGAKNKVSTASVLTHTTINGLINQADRSKRWYPLPKVKNAKFPKGEPTYQEFEDGSKKFVKTGVRTGEMMFADSVTPSFVGVLNGGKCTELGVYIVDNKGNLLGYTYGETGSLYPVPLNKSTMDAIFEFATDATVTTSMLKFEFDVDLEDAYLRMIKADSITGLNLLNVNGLIDVYSVNTAVSQTSHKTKLYLDEGDLVEPIVVTGLVAGDFALYNVTGSAAVTISTCVESPAGTYTFTYASQTLTNVLRITPTKASYDFTNVIAKTHIVA
jgi:hypothetical protein